MTCFFGRCLLAENYFLLLPTRKVLFIFLQQKFSSCYYWRAFWI